MEEQCLILVDAYALAAGEEPDFIPSRSEDCDAEKCVGGSFYDGHLSEDRSEVGVVGAVKSCAVTEDDVEGPFPSLRYQVELVDGVRIGHGDVGSTVHYSRFTNLGAHARGDGSRELVHCDY